MLRLLTTFSMLSLLGSVLPSSGAEKHHAVVFEVTSDHPEDWTAVLNNVENLRNAMGVDRVKIELVAHGEGLAMLVSAGNPSAARISGLAKAGVVFAACQNTMKRQHVAAEQLVIGVTSVDSGVAEVVRKQEEGWSYIRSR